MLRGKLQAAIRYLTDRDGGGILQPDNIDAKSGLLVSEVLESKHPAARVPNLDAFEDFGEMPEFLALDITTDSIEKVARKPSGRAGLSGTDSTALQWTLLRFGDASHLLQGAVADFTK